MFGELVIIDRTTGASYGYVPTDHGYREAGAKIDYLMSMGHELGGDVELVKGYLQPSYARGEYDYIKHS